MSRQHRGGYCPPAKRFPKVSVTKVTPLGMQVVNQMADAIVAKKDSAISHTATILTFFNQYSLTQMEWLNDVLDGDSSQFSGELLRLGKAAVAANERFIKTFEKQINPVSRQEWMLGYDQFQQAMDNYFTRESEYEERGEGKRTREINRAAALRYHDPYEKNPQRNFEAGFRLGAAYADLPPTGTILMKTDEGEKAIPIEEVVKYYVDHNYPQEVKVSVEVQLNKA